MREGHLALNHLFPARICQSHMQVYKLIDRVARLRKAYTHVLSSVLACRGQGEALTVDRHHLYQALYRTLGHSSLGSLEPTKPPANAPHQQVNPTAAAGLIVLVLFLLERSVS